MAKRKRDQLKKKAGQVLNHYDNVNLQIIELYNMFKDVHPDLAEALQIAVQTNLIAEQIFVQFAIKCGWGDKDTLLKYISKTTK